MSDFNFNEVVIDRVHRIHEYDLNGKRLWTMNQVKDFKLTLGGETVYAQDAQGVNIMAFDKSKTAEADWSNALMHLGALAEQMGSKKEVASSEAKQVFTTVEYLTSADGKKLTLTHTPKTAAPQLETRLLESAKKNIHPRFGISGITDAKNIVSNVSRDGNAISLIVKDIARPEVSYFYSGNIDSSEVKYGLPYRLVGS